MKDLHILKIDLDGHIARRENLKTGKAGAFIRREGFIVSEVVESYDRIIAQLEAEIAEAEAEIADAERGKKTTGKKTTGKKTTGKKTTGKKTTVKTKKKTAKNKSLK